MLNLGQKVKCQKFLVNSEIGRLEWEILHKKD